MAEILSTLALQPLRGKYVLLPHLNVSSIDGINTTKRSIKKKTAIAPAVDDAEGVAFTAMATYGVGSNVELVPTPKVQGISPTITSITKAMGGATRESVLNAIQGNNPAIIPFVRDCVEELLHSHYLRAETDALALFSGASESAGTTTQNLTFATMLDAIMKLSDNNVEDESAIAICIDEVGLYDLRSQLTAGSGAALSALFSSNTVDLNFFKLNPDASRTGIKGSIMGAPLYCANKAIMATANAGADRVGAIYVAGSGETAEPNSVRGFAELCEGYAPSVGFEYSLRGDSLDAIARYSWICGEHTDEHIVKLIYGIT
jgi:hypothetical protein